MNLSSVIWHNNMKPCPLLLFLHGLNLHLSLLSIKVNGEIYAIVNVNEKTIRVCLTWLGLYIVKII